MKTIPLWYSQPVSDFRLLWYETSSPRWSCWPSSSWWWPLLYTSAISPLLVMGLYSDNREALSFTYNLFPILKQCDGHNDQQGPRKLYSFFLNDSCVTAVWGWCIPYTCVHSVFVLPPFVELRTFFQSTWFVLFWTPNNVRTHTCVPLWCSSCINQSYLDRESIYDQDLDQSYLDLESIYNLDLGQSYLLAPWVLCTQPLPQKVPADPFWGTGEA